LVIRGEKAGQKLEYNAEIINRPYGNLGGTEYRTGVPAAIGIRMLGKRQITRKGAFSVENGIDPHIYFKELSRRDLYLDYTIKHRVS
jgi:saccharopine dehydrogenase-like NADP-dependent oxidoreductase